MSDKSGLSTQKSRAKGVFEALLKCLDPLEFLLDLLPDSEIASGFIVIIAVAAVGLILYGVFAITYQLVFDPNAVNIAAQLDSLSIDPDKWFPRS